MFKLMVVAGPNRGASYSVSDGETSIGRQSGNAVVLTSARVSKRHCVLVASNGQLLVKDQGSSNGTFVNGVLAKEKKIKNGDRISVGEFVFEVVESKSPSLPVTRPSSNSNVLQFPTTPILPGASSSGAPQDIQNVLSGPGEPKTLKEKAAFAFDQFAMPFFYGLAMKNEWRFVCVAIFAIFCVANMFVSVSPLLESSRVSVVRETGRRATFMARQIADNAAPLLANRAESRIDLGAAENAEGVKLAVVIDMDNRIVAPASRQNQYLTGGGESLIAVKARDAFRGGRETGFWQAVDSSTLVAIEPLKAFNQASGKNVVIGMSVVSVDTSGASMGFGDVGLVYSEILIITAILGLITLLILHRLTLKPLQVLNDDMDKVLKGEMTQVTHEFKWEELNALWDLINSALQRIPKSSSGFGGMGKTEPTISADDFAGPLSRDGDLRKDGRRRPRSGSQNRFDEFSLRGAERNSLRQFHRPGHGLGRSRSGIRRAHFGSFRSSAAGRRRRRRRMRFLRSLPPSAGIGLRKRGWSEVLRIDCI